MKDCPEWGLQGQGVWLGDRMGQCDVANFERPSLNGRAERNDINTDMLKATLNKFCLRQMSGERGRIDGRLGLQPGQNERDCPDMIFMRMGQKDRVDAIALVFKKRRIRCDEINTWRVVAAKGDANIDKNPAAIMLRTVAISIQIHPDLSASA